MEMKYISYYQTNNLDLLIIKTTNQQICLILYNFQFRTLIANICSCVGATTFGVSGFSAVSGTFLTSSGETFLTSSSASLDENKAAASALSCWKPILAQLLLKLMKFLISAYRYNCAQESRTTEYVISLESKKNGKPISCSQIFYFSDDIKGSSW